ncbi:PKD domain-containing protein [Fulvivirgaceae bacterium PWU4]|uniref:PKD domain-containing protein n=1 Tax=Chryseosolibacter histidini TaxID=2782349 RepID=A0AAP2DQZ0_9BACT|nr:PKD domain-containing protein [Chryseosolibacter histidini]MBT1698714.1 PKD domain-containing protein [Chryseosolibacter histidini]
MKHVRSLSSVLFVFFCLAQSAGLPVLASSSLTDEACAQASLQIRETGEPGKLIFDVASDKAIVSLRWYVMSQNSPWTYSSGPRWEYTGTQAEIPFAVPFNGKFKVRVDIYHKTAPDQLCQVMVDKVVEVSGLSSCATAINAKLYGKAAYEFSYSSAPGSPSTTGVLWEFGDGSTSVLSWPTHTYAEAGTYTVKLTRTGNGCTSESYHTLEVGCDKVKAKILSEKYDGPGQYSFSAEVTEDVKQWQWDFGDGGSWVNRWSVAYKYDYDGTYPVRYKATTTGGCVVTAEDVVTITDAHLCGQATLDIQMTDEPGKIYYIIDSNKPILSTSIGIAGIDQSWAYSSGTRWDYTGTHLELYPYKIPYNGPARVGVMLSYEYATGKYCYTDLDDTVVVTGHPCSAKITAEAQGETGFKFTLSGKNLGNATTGTTLWEFGDGSTSADFQSFHSYAAAGQYIVKATRSYYGCTAVAYDTVNVCISGEAPMHIEPGASAGEYQFSVNASDIITEAYWSIDTDKTNIWFGEFYDLNTTTHKVSHKFAANGTYYLWGFFFTRQGCWLESYEVLEVNDATPGNCEHINAAINASKTGPGRYDLSVTPADNLRTGFVWDLGDGKTSNVLHPSYQYGENGTYTVTFNGTTTAGCPVAAGTTVTVTDAISCGKASLQVHETGESGKFLFRVISDKPVVGMKLDLSGIDRTWSLSSSGQWSESDNRTQPEFVHSIPFNGPFRIDVSLQYPASHCSVSLADTIMVRDHACAASITSSQLGEGRYRFSLTGSNTGIPGTGFTFWEFGDGTTSTEFQPLHTYITTGTFLVKVTRWYYGCMATAHHTVKVCFSGTGSVSMTTISSWKEYTFQVTSPDSITEVKWSISDTKTELWSGEYHNLRTTAQSIPYEFPGKGAYTVSASYHTSLGCSYEARLPLKLSEPNPDTLSCEDVKATIDAQETAPGTYSFMADLTEPFQSDFIWDFGNGETSTAKNPQHQYHENGVYKVTFSCNTGRDCAIKAQHTLVVTGVPENITTGIPEQEGDGLVTYPNPSQGLIYFTKPVRAVIYDATGKQVLSLHDEDSADLTTQGAGLYYLRPEQGRAVKIVVRR